MNKPHEKEIKFVHCTDCGNLSELYYERSSETYPFITQHHVSGIEHSQICNKCKRNQTLKFLPIVNIKFEEKLVVIGDCFVDKNNNSWDRGTNTSLLASYKSESLINCHNCYNCRDLENESFRRNAMDVFIDLCPVCYGNYNECGCETTDYDKLVRIKFND